MPPDDQTLPLKDLARLVAIDVLEEYGVKMQTRIVDAVQPVMFAAAEKVAKRLGDELIKEIEHREQIIRLELKNQTDNLRQQIELTFGVKLGDTEQMQKHYTRNEFVDQQIGKAHADHRTIRESIIRWVVLAAIGAICIGVGTKL